LSVQPGSPHVPQYRPLDTTGVPIPMLNQLLKSAEFWGELEEAGVDHVLFFQTDSLLVHGNISQFMQVGAGPAGPAGCGAGRGRVGSGAWVFANLAAARKRCAFDTAAVGGWVPLCW
jgi:hypothetical protein